MKDLPKLTKQHFDLLYAIRDEYIAADLDDEVQILTDVSKHIAYGYGRQAAIEFIKARKERLL